MGKIQRNAFKTSVIPKKLQFSNIAKNVTLAKNSNRYTLLEIHIRYDMLRSFLSKSIIQVSYADTIYHDFSLINAMITSSN